MALINCPNCNNEIIEIVKTCPKCGYTFVEEMITKANEVAYNKQGVHQAENKKNAIIAAFMGIVLLVGLYAQNKVLWGIWRAVESIWK